MKHSEKKKTNVVPIIAITAILLIILLCVVLIVPRLTSSDDNKVSKNEQQEPKEPSKPLETQGTFADIYGYEITDSTGQLASVYLKNSTYKVLSFDEKSMTAEVRVKIPAISKEIGTVIKKAADSSSADSYDTFKNDVFSDVEDYIDSEDMEFNTSTINLPVKVSDNRFVLEANEELHALLTDDIIKASKEYMSLTAKEAYPDEN